jgi:hypothetical protein
MERKQGIICIKPVFLAKDPEDRIASTSSIKNTGKRLPPLSLLCPHREFVPTTHEKMSYDRECDFLHSGQF